MIGTLTLLMILLSLAHSFDLISTGIDFALIVINYVNAHEEEPPVPEKW